jgi:hypothetical protein
MASSRCRVPTRADAANEARPGALKPLEREVIQLQREAGNRAVRLALQRQATVQLELAADAGFRIISPVWQVAGRDIVVVATGHGDQVLFFYRRTGLGYKGAGVAPKAGAWTPFKTLMAQDASIIGREIETQSKGVKTRIADPEYRDPRTNKLKRANPKEAWFNKQPYYSQVHPDDPLRGMANARNQQVSQWLEKQNVPAGQVKHWETVEQEMDQVANRYRAAERMKGKPTHVGARHGPIAGAEVKGAGTEAKAAGTEAKALGTEAKAVGVEAKAVRAELAGVEVATGAAKASKVARLGKLLLALALPGPLDVFFIFIQAFASIAEAKAKLRADAYATGFAQGLAAAVTWISPEDAKDMLMYKVATPSMGERVAGFEGVRERGSNEGVAAGWKFGANLNTEQRKGFRREALSMASLKEKRRYSRNEYIDMGIALRPTVVELLAEAERQEREKEARAIIAAQQAAGGWRPPM